MQKLSLYLLILWMLLLSWINWAFSTSTPVWQPTPVWLPTPIVQPTPKYTPAPEVKPTPKVQTWILVWSWITTKSWTILKCADELNPFCWVKYIENCNDSICKKIVIYKTFKNLCELQINNQKYELFKEWECNNDKNTISECIELTPNLIVKLTNSVDKLVVKIKWKYEKKEERVKYINLIIKKLEIIKNKKKEYKCIVDYLIVKLKIEIWKINEDDTELENDNLINMFE